MDVIVLMLTDGSGESEPYAVLDASCDKAALHASVSEALESVFMYDSPPNAGEFIERGDYFESVVTDEVGVWLSKHVVK